MDKPRLISQFMYEPWPTNVDPRECDHTYVPMTNGVVECPLCGWYWDPEDEVLSDV
jgi:hypothetical protein